MIRTVALIILMTGFFACSGENQLPGTLGKEKNSEETNYDIIQATDGNGEELKIKKPARRIIVEYIDNAELVRILDRADRIVGIAGYDYVFEKCLMQFPEIRKKPTVGLFWKFDYEAVLGLRPDLILTFSGDTSEKREKLPGVDVLFLGLYYPDLKNPLGSRFVRGVKTLGKILDAESRSDEFIKWYIDHIEMINSRITMIPDCEKPSVFITSYPHANPDTTTFSAYLKKDTLTQAVFLAGGKSISESLAEYNEGSYGIKVDLEWVLEKDPDIIIMHAVDMVDLYGYETDDPSKIASAIDQLLSRPELARLKAVKNKRVYLFDGHFRNDASGGIVAAAYIAKILYPDRFADINPEAIHQEYIDMQGLDYNLQQHGIFLYPPLINGDELLGIPDKYFKLVSDVKR